ncbi:hypothetical protein [Phaeovulum sp. W22_SRMD_FR3]|uniref:hypothetical protein n=1 Tax=Phaeovulum sp. W22_SRMD_FR3 TaxID=3240274 RepID=UPI003F9BD91F
MSEAKAEYRARVKALLVERLRLAGLRRPSRFSVADQDAVALRLGERLGYMTAENLKTLAETLINNSGDGIWPSERVVMIFAHSLQEPPLTEHRIIGSWLASVEGPKAEAGGYLVELYRYLARAGRPPMPVDARQIRTDAAANARQVMLIRDRIGRDAAGAEDRAWLEHYLADQQAARAIVAAGAEKRAEDKGQAA